MMPNEQRRNADRSVFYRIRIQGHLGKQWTTWFDGLTLTLEEDGNTLLSGPVADQSALHGILKKIRDLGMPLLSVSFVDSDPVTKKDIDQVKGDVC
jgi:hypothetical protein